MAKAKKSEAKPETKSASAPAAKKKPAAAAAKPAAKASAGAGTHLSAPASAPHSAPQSAPLIDTSHVAESAARMLTAGLNRKNAGGAGSKPVESSMFKQLKSGLNKPTNNAMSSLLDKTHGPSNIPKSGSNFNTGGKQVGHNQTFGADVAKSGVPRRTSGG